MLRVSLTISSAWAAPANSAAAIIVVLKNLFIWGSV
jgi:hypothetical protein